MMPGQASSRGTRRLADRAGRGAAFYRRSRGGLLLSSIGVGMYKGAVSDEADEQWRQSIETCLAAGINVYDTAIRYRAMRSERLLGRALRDAFAARRLSRDEVFVSTKGGLIPIPEGSERHEYVRQEVIGRRGVPADRVYADLHCLDAAFLSGEIERSREHLGLATIDCWFIHNPELAFLTGDRQDVLERLRQVFAMLEEAVSAGRIASYGLSSWNGFRRRPGSSFHLDMEAMTGMAAAIAGDGHHLRFVELPLSVGMPFTATHAVHGSRGRTAIALAADLGLDVLTSASLYEGKLDVLLTLDRLMRLAGRADSPADEGPARVTLPLSENSIAQLFETLLALRRDGAGLDRHLAAAGADELGLYPAALQVIRSTPGVLSALAGVEHPEYAAQHARLRNVAPLPRRTIRDLWRRLAATGRN